jgi:hypothetical protein
MAIFNNKYGLHLMVIILFMTTILSIAHLSLFACYWSLRHYINHLEIHSLRGSD